MSDARREIFERLRSADFGETPFIARVPGPAMPDRPIATLRERLQAAGGVLLQSRRESLRDALPSGLESARTVHSNVAGIPSRGIPPTETPGPETASAPFDRLDYCVLEAEFAVVESAAVWHVPASASERAAALLAEHLILVVAADALVPTLHQAYARIDLGANVLGWFLCGPSKTADIEQSLVFGAHGPRTMHLVLLED